MSTHTQGNSNLMGYSNEIRPLPTQERRVGVGVGEPHKLYNNFCNSPFDFIQKTYKDDKNTDKTLLKYFYKKNKAL